MTSKSLVLIGGAVVLLMASAVVLFSGVPQGKITSSKPLILYVNQGNGIVNQSNFDQLLSFSVSHGFNTIFFQVYRSGSLLFSATQLNWFVNQSHSAGIRIYLSLYFTSQFQTYPGTIYRAGEDGISLDMSSLTVTAQEQILQNLSANYHYGRTAVTTTDLASPLKPDLLVLETYGTQFQRYIRPGIIASVGAFLTTSRADYEQQLQYALNNSDGVMVFDYAGLLKHGY